MQRKKNMNTHKKTGNGFDFEAMINGLISLCNDTELVICLDKNGVIKHVKANTNHWLLSKGAELIGQCIWNLLPADNITEKRKTVFTRVLESGRPERYEDEHHGLWFDSMLYPVFDKHKRVMQIVVMGRDITKIKHAEMEIMSLNAHLEQLVAERTAELEDLNVTLRVMLQKRDEDKAHWEEQVKNNIRQLITPHIKKLQQSTLDPQHQEIIHSLQASIGTLTSPFNHKLNSKYTNLTPKEIQIANLIKDGQSTKEIAVIMNTALKTVTIHREHIRNKLGIKNRSVNLRTHLLCRL